MKALTLKTIACATLFAAGLATLPAQAASPAPASAAVQVQTAQTPLVEVGHKHRKWRRHNGGVTLYFGTPKARRGHFAQCTTSRAMHKASSYGVRHARVVWSNHRVIKVRGYKHGHRVTINFGRAPSCPVYSSY